MAKNRPKPIEHQIVESILRGIVAIIKLPLTLFSGSAKSNRSNIDRKEIENRWLSIVELISDDANKLSQAIMMADKLLDAALVARGATGKSLGERLKSLEKYFSNQSIYQGAWDAHKLRNQIAHEIDHVIDSQHAKEAIEKLRQAIFCLI